MFNLDFEKFINEIFEDLTKLYPDNNIVNSKQNLMYIFINEDKYKSENIYNMIRPKYHTINFNENIIKSTEQKYNKSCLNFYQYLDEIFDKLYEKYGWEEYIVQQKNKIIDCYEKIKNKNSMMILKI
jgi:hypothetical protein